MLKAEEVNVQSYATLSLISQAFHVRRLWLLALGFFLYRSYGLSYSLVIFFMILALLSRIAPLRVKDKDGLVYYFLMRQLFMLSKRIDAFLSRITSHFLNLLSVSFMVLALPVVSYAQEVDFLNMMSKEEIRKLLKELESKEKILRQQEDIIYGGEKELFIRAVNHFDYHPDFLVVFVFDRNIEKVVLHTQSGKAVYEKNTLFLAPPSHEDGRHFTFAVVLEDGMPYYFAGRKVSITDPSRRVTVYYRFTMPKVVKPDEVIEAFIKSKGRCPVDSEVFSAEGRIYKFIKLKENIIKGADEVFCGGAVFKLHRL